MARRRALLTPIEPSKIVCDIQFFTMIPENTFRRFHDFVEPRDCRFFEKLRFFRKMEVSNFLIFSR